MKHTRELGAPCHVAVLFLVCVVSSGWSAVRAPPRGVGIADALQPARRRSDGMLLCKLPISGEAPESSDAFASLVGVVLRCFPHRDCVLRVGEARGEHVGLPAPAPGWGWRQRRRVAARDGAQRWVIGRNRSVVRLEVALLFRVVDEDMALVFIVAGAQRRAVVDRSNVCDRAAAEACPLAFVVLVSSAGVARWVSRR